MTMNRGQGLLVVDAGATDVEHGSYYLTDVDGKAQLTTGSSVQEGAALAKVLLVVMPPRPKGQTPEPLDV